MYVYIYIYIYTYTYIYIYIYMSPVTICWKSVRLACILLSLGLLVVFLMLS